jgi:Fe-S cluster biosynthesis and repair protein YggX
MDNAARIAQFENMTQADPTNEMAHFSLGRAYAESGRPADAARAYLRCIELVPDMSKAYQLAGESLVKAGDTERAKAVLRQGYTIAAGKGDFMPKNAMAKMLADLGDPVAEAPAAPGTVTLNVDGDGPVPEGMIRDRQSGRIGTRMTRPPFRGKLGDWIAANISRETFDAWIRQGTKVINEMRLDLSREKDQETYDQHMREFLGVDEKDLV